MLIPQLFTGPRQFDASGRFFTYVECTTLGTRQGIGLVVDGQPVGVLLPGESFELDEQCDRWEIYPLDPACMGRVLIGNGRMNSGRVTGPVETASEALSSVLDGREYVAGNIRFAAATLFACIGLQAGAKPLVVRDALLSGQAGAVGIYRGTGFCTAPVATQPAVNKLSTGAASSAQIHSFDSAAPTGGITGITLGGRCDATYIGGGVPFQWINGAPVIVPAGESLWVLQNTAAQIVGAHFEWREL